MNKLALMLGFALVLACGGSDGGGAEEPLPPKAEPSEPATATAQPASMLEPSDMTIIVEGKELLRVGAAGDIEANLDGSGNWQNVGTIAGDAWTKDGKEIARVAADGTVSFGVAGGPTLSFNGATLSAGQNQLAVGDDGVVTGLNPGAEGAIKVVGATGEAQKRTALLVTVSIFMVGKAESESSASSPSGPEPQPVPEPEPGE